MVMMNMRTFGFAGAVIALAVMIGLVAGSSTVGAKSVPGGSVFITGHDPDYHALTPSYNPSGAQELMRKAIVYARNGSKKPLLVVLGDLTLPSAPSVHRNSLLGLDIIGEKYVVMDASQFADADLSPKKYAAIFVPSDDGGILRQAELNALNARKDDIRAYLNGGGGLVALAEANGGAGLTPAGGHFDFLPVSVSSAPFGHSSVGTVVTGWGMDNLDLTDADVDGNWSQLIFEDAAGMNVVDLYRGDIMSLAYRGFYGQDEIVVEDENGKISICHATGNKDVPYHLIVVPASAMETHFPGHEDFFPDPDCLSPPEN